MRNRKKTVASYYLPASAASPGFPAFPFPNLTQQRPLEDVSGPHELGTATSFTMTVQHSGLQKEVLALYRRALRMVQTKPPPVQPKFRLFVQHTFKTQAFSLSPKDISAIEHLLRKGKKQLEVYEDPKVRDCWVSKEMRDWDERHRRRTNSKLEGL
ncbi:hypothetical protein QCA50_006639 [Cerrena zonata]|uniref:Complex 1 LYR protein domain-containing protein n=1 Tax=Cerrena zonata TaxID=2478898 RepID=A0AAW0GJG0_9APHY